jgi:hypothetical protein
VQQDRHLLHGQLRAMDQHLVVPSSLVHV